MTENGDKGPDETNVLMVIGLAIIVIFMLWCFPSCSSSPSSSYHSSSSYSSSTKSGTGWDAAVEGASHYHYDSAGHIYRD